MQDPKELLKVLVTQNYVSRDDARAALQFNQNTGKDPVDYLVDEEITSRDLIGQAIGEHFKVRYRDLTREEPPRALIAQFPEELARANRAVLSGEKGKELSVVTSNPEQPDLLKRLQEIFPGRTIKLEFSFDDDIENVLHWYQKPLQTRFSAIIAAGEKVVPEIIEEILEDALIYGASDIHFEPQVDIIIRFRVDGVLRNAGTIPRQFYDNVLNRVKVLSRMRIDEHLSAQDGAFRYQTKDKTPVDIRVSIAPTLVGEKIVMRLLGAYVGRFTLGELGLSDADEEIVKTAATKPFGMMLVTGPTGSGKTTTLYSLLKVVNRPEINITTIEDPVEYQLLGTNQIQVNSETNLTFANGLRSIVRQDPDVILVGEIRDLETAEIAVNASLTGHLLLSTFHTNDAATTIPRLLDMGIEPFILSTTLEMVVAQRLVRKICEECRVAIEITEAKLKELLPAALDRFKKQKFSIYKGTGCEHCNHTGYRGRVAAFEIVRITDTLRDLILNKPSRSAIMEQARKEGSHTLFEDALEKVIRGITTPDEVNRVIPYQEEG